MVLGKIVPTAFAVALVLAAGGLGVARAEEGDAAILAQAKISLADAVGIAEQQTGGKAVDAGLADEPGKPAFEVRLIKDNTSQTVLVDAESGTVVANVETDSTEQEGAGEQNDQEEAD